MRTTTVIIGAGHAGLAMSRRLTDRSIDHVVLERGEVANSWRTERWPSLRLLTPNWQTRLPGARYEGDDPDGFMSMPEVIGFISDYARTVSAPVQTNTTVTAMRASGSGYEVVTNQGTWTAPTVVLASGGCNLPVIPSAASAVPRSVTTLTSMTYRSPDQLSEQGVLIVGGSATGVQLADEIQRSGRSVTLSVGEHVRLPRLYRGRDIFWWMDAGGALDERYDEVDDLTRARHVPSPQLIGSPERVSIDINTLTANGVRIVGRLGRIHDGVAQFSGSLGNNCALADLKMNRLLDTIDEWATRTGLDARDQRVCAFSQGTRPATGGNAQAHAGGWKEVLDQALESLVAGLRLLSDAGMPPPDEVGYELAEDGDVVAEAELAWTSRRLVLLMPHHVDSLAIWTSQGWTTLVAEAGWPQTLSSLLKR